MAQGNEPATEATTTLTPAENERAAAEREARAKAFVSPRAVPFVEVRQVAVECNGNCGTITLQNACGLGFTPIAVDCGSVRDWNGTSCGGGNGLCASFSVVPTDFVSFYCDDGGGWDANVYCAR
jgi:hypothetical protein